MTERFVHMVIVSSGVEHSLIAPIVDEERDGSSHCTRNYGFVVVPASTTR